MQKLNFLILICVGICGIRAADNTTQPPSTNRSSLVQRVLQVIPLVKLEEIEKNHLQTDEGFKSAVLYLQSEEWKGLVDIAKKSAEYQKFAEMALMYKLNISQCIEFMRNHIDSLSVPPPKENATANLSSFVRDIQKVLSIGEIAKVLADSDDPETRNLRLQFNTKENEKIAQDIYNLAEVTKMRDALNGMNFNVDPYIALFYTVLGWLN